MGPVAGILLAAGAGRRFHGHKLLHPLADGEPVGVAAGRNLIAAVPDCVAVVRAGDLALASALGALGLRIHPHPGADGGMGTSIAAGVSATPGAGGWLIALGDMPWVRPETIRALADALRAGVSLVAPIHAGRRGHPVGFAAAWGERLQALNGNHGARNLIAAHAERLVLLPTADPGVLRDVDGPADLERYDQGHQAADPVERRRGGAGHNAG
jgi:molybdenum cofactor cytidylyltransferase